MHFKIRGLKNIMSLYKKFFLSVLLLSVFFQGANNLLLGQGKVFKAEVYKINKYTKEIVVRAPDLQNIYSGDILYIVNKKYKLIATVKIVKLLETLVYTKLDSGKITKIKKGMAVYRKREDIKRIKEIRLEGKYPAYLWEVEVVYEKDGINYRIKRQLEIGDEVKIKVLGSDQERIIKPDDIESINVMGDNSTRRCIIRGIIFKELGEYNIEYVKGINFNRMILPEKVSVNVSKLMSKEFSPSHVKKVYPVHPIEGLKTWKEEKIIIQKSVSGRIGTYHSDRLVDDVFFLKIFGGWEFSGYGVPRDVTEVRYHLGLGLLYMIKPYFSMEVDSGYTWGSVNQNDDTNQSIQFEYVPFDIIGKFHIKAKNLNMSITPGCGLGMGFAGERKITVTQEGYYTEDLDYIDGSSEALEEKQYSFGIGWILVLGADFRSSDSMTVSVLATYHGLYFKNKLLNEWDAIDTMSLGIAVNVGLF